jgi:GntR family transcriptional repressor for pyruvate dehydrogenase complex
METITSAMYDKRLKTVERSIDMRESAEMHREIYRAVRARDPLEARRLMEQHLRMAQASQGMERSPARKTAQGAARPKRVQAELKATPLEKNVSATVG